MTDTITSIRLGYGGRGFINGTEVLMTSGSLENSVSPAYTSGYLAPMDETNRSRVLHADGTVTHSGSMGFDLTLNGLSVIENLMSRNQRFSVEMYDGKYGFEIGGTGEDGCVLDTITVNGTPNGFIAASLNFSCRNPASKKFSSLSTNNRDSHISDIIPYWWSGNSYVRDWNLTYSQTVTPKFSNLNRYQLITEGILASSPVYLFVGEVSINLDFNTFCPLVTDTVYIATDSFKIVGRTTATGYSIGGLNELPSYRYSIQSSAIGKNDQNILTLG
ncbi:MAG: hypothetical protein M0P12_00740 [Paludibacteraceae bacterium]|nr:hypothetical protein [Paludibacteraceae bacterium]MCK9616097.1 hypothetical protein [Candidatus Omnitrophota bacterium]